MAWMSSLGPSSRPLLARRGGEGENIGCWSKRLRSSYLRANNGRDVSPSELIQAIDSALGGEASEFVCGNPLLDQIVDQADDFTATQDDLVMFENALRALRDRFDVDAEVEVAHDGPFLNVAQGDGESLEAYHGRVLSIYRARGGRDKPVFADQPALTALEVSSISEWVYRFVLGLRDESLAHDAIDRGVLMFDSFRSAFQIVKESSGRLDVKVNVARAMAQQARINLIEEWFKQQLGHSANEELSRAYGLPNSLFDACGGPRDQAVPAQPSMSAQGISGGWNYYQPDQAYFPPVPQQRYDYWPQQTNVFQSAPAPAPAPVQARNATVDVSDWCPPMEHEETEVAVVEDVITIEDAAIVEDVILVEDITAVEDVAAVEDVIIVEDVVAVEDVAAVEDVITVEDVVAVEDVAVEGVTTDEDVTADEDEILPSVLVPLVREKAVKRSTRALSEILIRGCEGIGPVIWKGLVAFLMEPWMIDREVPTQIRSSRESSSLRSD
ncbi:hypothetical protein E4U23_007581 [Claviceps purpurea]|nr:hypothetical protein E4U23_007581 [Claviceps purpurea]